jgi:hypothetical protein
VAACLAAAVRPQPSRPAPTPLTRAAAHGARLWQAVAKPVDSDEDILNIATIATGSEAMGRTIASCFKRVGSNGATMVEDGQTLLDEIDFTEGMEIERGFISPYFVKNQEAQTCELESPRILVTDRKIGNMNELVRVLLLSLHARLGSPVPARAEHAVLGAPPDASVCPIPQPHPPPARAICVCAGAHPRGSGQQQGAAPHYRRRRDW